MEPKLKLLSQYWALKESYSKFLGVGLNQGLQNYQFLNISRILENNIHTEKLSNPQPFMLHKLDHVQSSLNQVESNKKGNRVEAIRFFLPGSQILASAIRKACAIDKSVSVIQINGVMLVEFMKQLQCG
ncbi:unnamed protein product [Ambrosiozyma monospora]|uniref:Unnamed protein product n=1 Tax=Ambrosiozyma monospora TaxID=43982 RepID=A0ACB5UBL4_AMBMO|nr:unnamed protein product [Ambrosiozyma monospora]